MGQGGLAPRGSSLFSEKGRGGWAEELYEEGPGGGGLPSGCKVNKLMGEKESCLSVGNLRYSF